MSRAVCCSVVACIALTPIVASAQDLQPLLHTPDVPGAVVSQPISGTSLPGTLDPFLDPRMPTLNPGTPVTQPGLLTKTVDLSETIRKFAKASQLSMNDARLQALMLLELAPRAMSGGTVGQYRKVETDVFQITAPEHFFEALPAMRQCLELGKKRVTVHVHTFGVAPEESDEVNRLLAPQSIKVHSSKMPSIDPLATVGDHEGEFAITTSVTRENLPITTGELTEQNLNQLIMFVRQSKQSDLLSNSRLNALPGQAGTLSTMSYRPFVVALESVEDQEGKSSHQPVVQALEDGRTIRVKAIPHDGKIRLFTDIAVSQVTGVRTFTYPSVAGGAAIQIPSQSVRKVHLASHVEPGAITMIDPNFMVDVEVRDERGRMKTVTRKLLVTLRAHVVDMDDDFGAVALR